MYESARAIFLISLIALIEKRISLKNIWIQYNNTPSTPTILGNEHTKRLGRHLNSARRECVLDTDDPSLVSPALRYLWPANCAPDTCCPLSPTSWHSAPDDTRPVSEEGGGGYQISMAGYVSSHSHTFDDFSRSSALTIAIIAMFYSALSAVATWCWVRSQCLELPLLEPPPRAAWGGALGTVFLHTIGEAHREEKIRNMD